MEHSHSVNNSDDIPVFSNETRGRTRQSKKRDKYADLGGFGDPLNCRAKLVIFDFTRKAYTDITNLTEQIFT